MHNYQKSTASSLKREYFSLIVLYGIKLNEFVDSLVDN